MAEQGQALDGVSAPAATGVSGEWSSAGARALETVQLLPEAALLLGPDGRVLAANARAGELFRREIDALVTLDSTELIAPAQRDLYRACLARVRAGSGSVHRELTLADAGRPLPLDVSIGGGRGSPPVFVALFRRSRLPFSELLAATAAAVQDALENGESSATIISRFLDRAARSTDCSAVQFWIIEQSRAELVRQVPSQAPSAVSPELVEALAYRAATSETGACLVTRFTPAGQAPLPALALPVNAGDALASFVVLLRAGSEALLEPEVLRVLELTALLLGQGLTCARLCAEKERLRSVEHCLRLRAEDAAGAAHREAQESSRSLAVVAHQLRNLLSNLSLNLDLLAQSSSLDPSSAERQPLERALRSAAHLRFVSESLQRVSAGSPAQVELAVAKHDVAELLQEAVRLQAPLASGLGLTLRAVLPPVPCSVMADRQRVLQVLSYLIGNAFALTKPAGAVVISADQRDTDVCCTVRDDGIGITPEQLSRILDPAFHAGRGGPSGNGLGLVIARSLVEAHAGTLHVESEPGRGTTVRFTLPAAS